MRNSYKIVVRTLQAERPLEKPRNRSKENAKINLTEIKWEDVCVNWV
jgi:hypothetical protein